MNAIVRGNPHTIQLKSFVVSVLDTFVFCEVIFQTFFFLGHVFPDLSFHGISFPCLSCMFFPDNIGRQSSDLDANVVSISSISKFLFVLLSVVNDFWNLCNSNPNKCNIFCLSLSLSGYYLPDALGMCFPIAIERNRKDSGAKVWRLSFSYNFSLPLLSIVNHS